MSPTQSLTKYSPGRIHCVDALVGLQTLPDASVDLVFTDPPFNIGYDYDVYDDKKSRDEFLAWACEWTREIQRVLKPTGHYLVCMGDEYVAELKVMTETAADTTRDRQLRLHQWIVWYYTFGVNCLRKLTRSHTHILHFVKSKRFFVQPDAVRVPSARQLHYADKRANPDGRLPDNTWILRPQELPDGFADDHDVWHFPRVCGTYKERAGITGTQMPEQLVGRAIRLYSPADGLVLDPFSGSGTTAVVAKKLGRRPLGFELSADYAARAQQRLEAAAAGEMLDPLPQATTRRPRAPKRGSLQHGDERLS